VRWEARCSRLALAARHGHRANLGVTINFKVGGMAALEKIEPTWRQDFKQERATPLATLLPFAAMRGAVCP
jgi:hypothetical protein